MTVQMSLIVEQGVAAWLGYMKSHDAAALGAMLADDAVFHSPIVHTPQRGKAMTQLYLTAAAHVLGNDSFVYDSMHYGAASAVLEFSCGIDGIQVNGIDMIRWNEAGLISEFKVMVRPLKAIEMVHASMGTKLQEFKAGAA